MTETPYLKLPLLAGAQAQKHVTHNEALIALDEVTQLSVRDSLIDEPPTNVNDGDRFIVSAEPRKVFSGQALKIAVFRQNYWHFHTPQEGWRAWVQSQEALFIFKQGSWMKLPSGGTQSAVDEADIFGINAAASPTNRLAVSSLSSLFTHDGSDHRLTLNKASTSDTGSIVFQTNYSGRAELGLTGSDDLKLRTSMDGATWLTRLRADQGGVGVSSPAFNSGRIHAPLNKIIEIPTPSPGGFFVFFISDKIYPQIQHSGIIVFDSGSSLYSIKVFTGNSVTDKGVVELSADTLSEKSTNLSVRPGRIQMANTEFGWSIHYSYIFLI